MGYQQPMGMGYGMPQMGGYPNMGAVQNAGYAQPNPQYNPMYGGAPQMGQPMMNNPQMMGGQPYMNQPQGGYQPQTTGFNMSPQGAAQPAQNAQAQPQQNQQPVNTPGAQYVQQTPPSTGAGKGTPGEVKVDTPFKG